MTENKEKPKTGYGSEAFLAAQKASQESYVKAGWTLVEGHNPLDHDGEGDVYPLMSADVATERAQRQAKQGADKKKPEDTKKSFSVLEKKDE